MRRVVAAAFALSLVANACSERSDLAEAALRRYVRAWTSEAQELRRTISGRDRGRLVDALEALRAGGASEADIGSVTRDGNRVGAEVTVRFADGAAARWRIRGRIERGRVLAEPQAVWSDMETWGPLHVDRYGSPRRGTALSRDGSPLSGSAPATDLIHDALSIRLGGSRGVRVGAGGERIVDVPVADATDVRTSLDDELQRLATEAFGDARGAFVVVDPRTGGIRALASDTPQAARTATSPGSTFKVVTAAAALEAGVLGRTDVVPCPAQTIEGGRPITNFRGASYGDITFERAFAVSCNTAFAAIGVRIGTSRLLATARQLGFRVGRGGGPATIAVPASRGELALWSFGAGGSRISPLHMAGVGATIAHEGRSVTAGWTDDGNIGRRALARKTADELVAMMETVVSEGTGRNARTSGVTVAGKTGTADPPGGGPTDAWFLGLYPSTGSELVAVVLLQGGGIGGERAAALASRFFTVVTGLGRR